MAVLIISIYINNIISSVTAVIVVWCLVSFVDILIDKNYSVAVAVYDRESVGVATGS